MFIIKTYCEGTWNQISLNNKLGIDQYHIIIEKPILHKMQGNDLHLL